MGMQTLSSGRADMVVGYRFYNVQQKNVFGDIPRKAVLGGVVVDVKSVSLWDTPDILGDASQLKSGRETRCNVTGGYLCCGFTART